MLAKDLMWKNPAVISPAANLKEAASRMAELDSGVLAVALDGKPAGIITDRDIVTRAISKGKDPNKETVADYMTKNVVSCKENTTIEESAVLMKKNKVSRLAVMNAENKISGILSFEHLIRNNTNADDLAGIVSRISKNGGGRAAFN